MKTLIHSDLAGVLRREGELELERGQMVNTELTPGIMDLVTILLVSVNGHTGVCVQHEAHCHLPRVKASV